MSRLNQNIQYVKGIGPKRAYLFKRLNVETIKDLIYFIPREYEDRSRFKTLKEGINGQKISLEIETTGDGIINRPRNKLTVLKVPFKDSSGFGTLIWFNQAYFKDNFKIGDKFNVNGKLNKIGTQYQIINPVFEKSDNGKKVGRIIPIYSLTEGLKNNVIIKIMEVVLKENLKYIDDALPPSIMNKYNFISTKEAINKMHFPNTLDTMIKARKQLAYEELLILQLGLFLIKKSAVNNRGIKFSHIGEVFEFIDNLPFKLTNSQKKVINEIIADMESTKQMNRLIQGDVGSGKTIVAIVAMYKAVLCGYQATMMAPTEILAMQHFESLSNIFESYNIRCELLVGSLSKKKKDEILGDLKSGKIDIIVGTHAIIQEGVEFNNLGLAITDEQHRFGVKQRATLRQKGVDPDILVMTATPIPRTLALILYGDLDISIISELPPGRKEIKTYAVDKSFKDRIYKFIEKHVTDGRQVYIVCPTIEESETQNLNSAEELHKFLKDEVFSKFKLGLLHGKMNQKDKDDIMNRFKSNDIQILVSTTVIEVGVNVSNANIMVIFNAERFGLAQLHQLRGRVGRGDHQSYCILIYENSNPISRERMKILQSTSDGFIISEKDLELRGPGEFFGTRQHGIPELKIANLILDLDILKIAQKDAQEIIRKDPTLSNHEHCILKCRIDELFKKNDND